MELAALLAAGLGDWIDFGVICGILLLNAIVGWYQEKQAADVVASLRGDIAMKATVVRGKFNPDLFQYPFRAHWLIRCRQSRSSNFGPRDRSR
jgi:magnesium-transporting ATPase (P-type)